MTPFRFLTLGALVLAVAGCKREATFTEPLPALAAIHWVNAVPDTAAQDLHLVDIPSNAGLFGAAFRDANMFYQPVEAGSRRIKAFMAAPASGQPGAGSPGIAQTVLTELPVTLAENMSYTFIHQGFARTGQVPGKSGVLIPDNPPTPGASQIAVRIINAAAGVATNLDMWVVKRAVNAATADSLSDTRSVSNIAYAGLSNYLTFPIDGTGDATRVVVTATGTKTPILAQVTAPAGVAGVAPPGSVIQPPADPIAGATQSGSVLTAVVVPRSVAGSQAPQALTTPGVIYLVDKRPQTLYP